MTSRRDVTGMMARKGYLNETAFFPSKVNPRYFFLSLMVISLVQVDYNMFRVPIPEDKSIPLLSQGLFRLIPTDQGWDGAYPSLSGGRDFCHWGLRNCEEQGGQKLKRLDHLLGPLVGVHMADTYLYVYLYVYKQRFQHVGKICKYMQIYVNICKYM